MGISFIKKRSMVQLVWFFFSHFIGQNVQGLK